MAKGGQSLGEQSDPDRRAQTYYSRGELSDSHFFLYILLTPNTKKDIFLLVVVCIPYENCFMVKVVCVF